MVKSGYLALFVLGTIVSSPVCAGAWSDPPKHVEIYFEHGVLDGGQIFSGKRPSSSAREGVGLYADYLPFKWKTQSSSFYAGPYGSVSMIGDVGKIAGGIALAYRPDASLWEVFTRTGVRYTTDAMRYQSEGKTEQQGQGAFDLALGGRFYLQPDTYLSLAIQHNSSGRDAGIPLFKKDANPGFDSLVIGFGWTF